MDPFNIFDESWPFGSNMSELFSLGYNDQWLSTSTSSGETPNLLGCPAVTHPGSNIQTYGDFPRVPDPRSNEITQANSPGETRSKKRPPSPEPHPVKRPRGNGSSRFKSEVERRETRNTRDIGACFPCQNSKRRCASGPDPNGPCARCLERNMKPGIALCFRPKIRDIEVFRRGGANESYLSCLYLANGANDKGPTLEFTSSRRWKMKDIKPDAKSIWKPITELPTGRSDIKVVELSQGHSKENLRLHVREYNPEPGDRQYYTWYDGDTAHSYGTTPYAIANLTYARNAIKKFLEKNLKVYLNVLLRNASPITKRTFETAQSQDLTLLEPALKLWVASRFIETPWHIAGSETLGMSKDTRVNSPYRVCIPQTPIMDFQLDNLVIYGILQPLLKEILITLRAKTVNYRKEDWFELQLTHYILLNTVELTMAHDIEFARQHNINKSRWSNCPLIEMVTQGANTLLTYFHNANSGHYPFSAPWLDVERSYLWSEGQKSYIMEIRRLLSQQGEVVTEPEKEMFWTGQLHRADWSAVSVAV